MQLNNLNTRLTLNAKNSNLKTVQVNEEEPMDKSSNASKLGKTEVSEFKGPIEKMENSPFCFWWRTIIGFGSDWGISFWTADIPKSPQFV